MDIPIRHGCVAVIGPNGSGKSSILQAIDVTLFGGRLERFLKRGETELEVAVELDHGGETYRVRRHYSARAKGKSGLEFARLAGSEWDPLALESQAATQGLIERTLRLSRATLRASAYLAQGDGGAFTEATPAARKVVLGEVLGLDVWDDLYARAVVDRKRAEQRLAPEQARVQLQTEAVHGRGSVEDELQDERRHLAVAEAEAIAAERAVSQVVERETAFREVQARFEAQEALVHELRQARDTNQRRAAALRERIDAHDADWAQADALRVRARAMVGLSEQIEAVRAEQAAWDAAARDADHARRDHERARARAAEAVETMAALQAQARTRKGRREQTLTASATCEACGQALAAPDTVARAVAAIDRELDDLRRRYSEAFALHRLLMDEAIAAEMRAQIVAARPDDPLDLDAALLGAHDASHRVATLEGRHEQIAEMRTEVAAATAEQARLTIEVVAAEAVLHDVLHARGGARPDVATAQTESRRAAGRVRNLAGVVAMREERLRLIDGAAVDLAASRKEVARLEEEIGLCERLVKAFGKDGIPALIVENAAIPQIELEAARILDDLGAPYRVELRTQRALKSGEGVRDTLDIVVLTDAGEALYEDFSGGEKTRLNLALRIALARLLAHRVGADVRFLAIDEPEFLDAAGTERLAAVLKGLRGDFDSIVLISHLPELRDAFDDVLVLTVPEVAAVG